MFSQQMLLIQKLARPSCHTIYNVPQGNHDITYSFHPFVFDWKTFLQHRYKPCE